MTDGQEFEHTGREIRDEIRIEAPAEELYRAWADPEAISSWFVTRMEGRVREGETIEWFWDESPVPGMTHEVVVAEAPHRMVTKMALPDGASYLEITIEQEGGHSVLRLVQSGFGEGPEWDDEYEGTLSGWMMALGVLKVFLERYRGRRGRDLVVLADAEWEREEVVRMQRTGGGVAGWLAESGEAGAGVGDPVRLVLADGRTLTGEVLRITDQETLWSWDEIGGVLELKAFRGAAWGARVGVRVSSWLMDDAELADLEGLLSAAVERLAARLAEV